MTPRDRILELLKVTRVPLSGAAISRICWIGSWRLYPALAALETDGLVTSAWGEPLNSPGNPRPRLYSLVGRCDMPRMAAGQSEFDLLHVRVGDIVTRTDGSTTRVVAVHFGVDEDGTTAALTTSDGKPVMSGDLISKGTRS